MGEPGDPTEEVALRAPTETPSVGSSSNGSIQHAETQGEPDELSALVSRFAQVLLAKLRVAEEKYGHNDAWLRNPDFDGMRRELREHVAKGDPRDVAAYCAFLWYHEESTASEGESERLADRLEEATTVLDEKFHRAAIVGHMIEAATLLRAAPSGLG